MGQNLYAGGGREHWLALTKFHGLGPALIKRLIEYFGNPEKVLAADSTQLQQVSGIGKTLALQLADKSGLEQMRKNVDAELAQLQRKNYSFLCPDDVLYPDLLKTIFDPPTCLYYHGNLECLQQPALAIIGSRAATSYGRQISFQLSRDLARKGITIVSGMAFGIDSESHRGALAGGGKTVAVLGCGLDVVYPPQNRGLYQEVAESGALLTEYPPGTRPEGFRFPARNRIISGCVLGVIVVEAALKSGSLITARLALEQGREVFAVPGRVDSVKSAGAHKLLQQGAHLVHNTDDILEELGIAMSMQPTLNPKQTSGGEDWLCQGEKQLLSCLDIYPVTIDEIVRSSGLPPGEIHSLLLSLEFKGMVKQTPGQQYGLMVSADK